MRTSLFSIYKLPQIHKWRVIVFHPSLLIKEFSSEGIIFVKSIAKVGKLARTRVTKWIYQRTISILNTRSWDLGTSVLIFDSVLILWNIWTLIVHIWDSIIITITGRDILRTGIASFSLVYFTVSAER